VEAYDGEDFLVAVAVADEFKLQIISKETCAHDVARILKDGNSDVGCVAGKSFLVTAPAFDPAKFDRLDWNKIKTLLEAADPEPVDEDPDQVQRTVYLGSVLNLTPSGKVYYPFACGNVVRCPFCSGTGNVDNPFMDEKLLEAASAERHEVTMAGIKDGLFCNWPEDLQARAKALDVIIEWARPTIGCPHCHSQGSREAYEDEEYRDYIEDKADELGAFITGSDGDGCDILIAKVEPAPEKEENEEDDEDDG
jgi:hypothetical protein